VALIPPSSSVIPFGSDTGACASPGSASGLASLPPSTTVGTAAAGAALSASAVIGLTGFAPIAVIVPLSQITIRPTALSAATGDGVSVDQLGQLGVVNFRSPASPKAALLPIAVPVHTPPTAEASHMLGRVGSMWEPASRTAATAVATTDAPVAPTAAAGGNSHVLRPFPKIIRPACVSNCG
jgi:hypothetical protein